MPNTSFTLSAPGCQPDDAVRFFDAWFGPVYAGDLITLVRIRTGPKIVQTKALPVSVATSAVREHGIQDLVYFPDGLWNVYYSVGLLTAPPPPGRRGFRELIKYLPGMWLDLDIKDGSFTTHGQITSFLDNFPVRPSIRVSTGSGGVHAYWRCSEPVSAAEAQRLGRMLWAHAERVSGFVVDKVSDPSRILRVPGTVNWRKEPSERPQLVRLEEVGADVRPQDIEGACSASWDEVAKRRRRFAAGVATGVLDAAFLAEDLTGWSAMYAIAHLEEVFNQTYSWESVLLPHGWTIFGHDHEGRTVWSRPGAPGRRAATTDWPPSPNVMSLFSDAAETGLRDLKDVERPLSKYRVYVTLTWNGDERGFIEAYIATLRDGGQLQ